MLKIIAEMPPPGHRGAAVLHGLLFAVPMAVLLWAGIAALVILLV
ncbi:hypothetical protein U1769_20175 [Sphingomonas sp. ZT3P38]